MKRAFLFVFLSLCAVPLAAVNPTPTPRPGGRRGTTHALRNPTRNTLLSAQRALFAAKVFLAKSPDDPAGHRSKAQAEVESALQAVTAQLEAAGTEP